MDKGVYSLGLRTQVLPKAMQVATRIDARARGAFHGAMRRCKPLGLAGDIGQQIAGLGVGLAAQRGGDLGEHFEILGRASDVWPHAGDRQSGVDHFEFGEFVGVRVKTVADRVEDVFSCIDIEPRPRALIEGAASGGTRPRRPRRRRLRAGWLKPTSFGRIDERQIDTARP